MTGNRIFILGAGFSHAAGLPLGPDLWKLVLSGVEATQGQSGSFARDMRLYCQYRRECDGITLQPQEVDFEDFLAFLDVEFRLRLSGSDTWSTHGNRSQVLVKQLIAQILMRRTPRVPAIPDCYLEFAKLLRPNDFVITFNYDTLLEQLLDHVGQAYRLFPMRFVSADSMHRTIDTVRRNEVIISKVHGSIDWFDRTEYDRLANFRAADGFDGWPRDAIFAPDAAVTVRPLVDGVRPDGDPLRNIYRLISAPATFYGDLHQTSSVPCLLTPSHAKALYAHQFAPYWDGLGQAGGWNCGFVIVGYSVPRHDDYARQVLFRLAHNYQEVDWGEPVLGGRPKSNVILVDYKQALGDQANMRKRYGFLDANKTDFIWTGFGADAVEAIRSGGGRA